MIVFFFILLHAVMHWLFLFWICFK